MFTLKTITYKSWIKRLRFYDKVGRKLCYASSNKQVVAHPIGQNFLTSLVLLHPNCTRYRVITSTNDTISMIQLALS